MSSIIAPGQTPESIQSSGKLVLTMKTEPQSMTFTEGARLLALVTSPCPDSSEDHEEKKKCTHAEAMKGMILDASSRFMLFTLALTDADILQRVQDLLRNADGQAITREEITAEVVAMKKRLLGTK